REIEDRSAATACALERRVRRVGAEAAEDGVEGGHRIVLGRQRLAGPAVVEPVAGARRAAADPDAELERAERRRRADRAGDVLIDRGPAGPTRAVELALDHPGEDLRQPVPAARPLLVIDPDAEADLLPHVRCGPLGPEEEELVAEGRERLEDRAEREVALATARTPRALERAVARVPDQKTRGRLDLRARAEHPQEGGRGRDRAEPERGQKAPA